MVVYKARLATTVKVSVLCGKTYLSCKGLF